MTDLDKALAKCDELDPAIREPTKEAVRSAFDKNMTFTISETRRTYERQCLLLSQGRTRSQIMSNNFPYGFKLSAKQMSDMMKIYDEGRNLQGPTVTWTLDSDHLSGVGMDVYPINTTYAELAQHFIKWGITHPYIQDTAHFNLSNAKSIDPAINVTPLARFYALSRALLRHLRPEVRASLAGEHERLRRRLVIK